MPTSPDLHPYVDLTLLDRTGRDIAVAALQDAASRMPGVVFREGMTEVATVEALAVVTAEQVTAINRIPNATTEGLVNLYGIVRDPGSPPRVSLLFTLIDTAGLTIPAGTEVVLDAGAGQALVIFTTDVDLVIAAGVDTGTVAATGLVNTVALNGLPSGTGVLLRSAIPASSVVTSGAVAGGEEPETDDAWFARAVARFDRLTETLLKPGQFALAALEQPGVFRALGLNRYNPAAGTGAPGDHPGHITVAVLGLGGVALTAGAKSDILAALEEGSGVEAGGAAHLVVHVIDAMVTAVAVTVTVVRKATATVAEVQAAVTEALGDYLDPDSWPWAATVYRHELIALVDGVAGVERVQSIDVPAADLPLAGVAPLADAGVITVNVVI